MKAIVKSKIPGKVTITDKELPILGEGEVLIEVTYCGICGSDIHAMKHSKGYEFAENGVTLGHEISGKVIKVFNKNNEYLLNKRVIIESMHYCGDCDNCQIGRYSICSNLEVIGLHFDGGMAQYVKVHSNFVQVVDDLLPIDIASLIEPMSIALHAVNKIKELGPGDKVLVQGPGIIGFFTGLIFAYKKADVILSGLENDYAYRLSKAPEFNMKPFVADKENLNTKVDYVFECSGSPIALKNSLPYLKKGGKIVVVALYEQEASLFLTDLVRNEWPLITSYGCDPDDYREASKILINNKDKLRKIISFFPIIEAEQAFKKSMTQKVLKAVLYN